MLSGRPGERPWHIHETLGRRGEQRRHIGHADENRHFPFGCSQRAIETQDDAFERRDRRFARKAGLDQKRRLSPRGDVRATQQHGECDDFLNDLQLRQIHALKADAIGGNL